MKKVWMVAADTTVAFVMNAQDASVETQAIGVMIDAHALVDMTYCMVIFIDDIAIQINTYVVITAHYF
ncbi:MAG: hypothetical protein L7U67_02800 [Schleiferiaceae bacterium]|nr:hypothetical protein [Schleiferiaceae bacterium]